MSRACALIDDYDLALLDLDGVVYIGPAAVPGAVEALAEVRSTTPALFVTNNASRTPEAVASHLEALGVPASSDEVLTSAQAAARYLDDCLDAAAAVMVVGGEGLRVAVASTGRPVAEQGTDRPPAAVVMGFGPDVGWRDLARAAHAVRSGAHFVATNLDLTVPTSHGPAPGNGALVAAVSAASRPPDVVMGKPQPHLFHQAAEAAGARRPLVVGDRLDTDIEGAVNAAMDSLLVMTGITDVPTLLQAKAPHRPTHVAADLRGLLLPVVPAPVPEGDAGTWRCRDAVVRRTGDRLSVLVGGGEGASGGTADGLDLLRAACAAAWYAPPGADWLPVDDVTDVRRALGR